MDGPLLVLHRSCMDLLELNSWNTDLGMARIGEHVKYERSRVGARAVAVTPFVGTK